WRSMLARPLDLAVQPGAPVSDSWAELYPESTLPRILLTRLLAPGRPAVFRSCFDQSRFPASALELLSFLESVIGAGAATRFAAPEVTLIVLWFGYRPGWGWRPSREPWLSRSAILPP